MIRRTAGEVLRSLEMRVARLERVAGSMPQEGDILVTTNNRNGLRSNFWKVVGVSSRGVSLVMLENVGDIGINGGFVTPGRAVGSPVVYPATANGNGYSVKMDRYTGEAVLWNGRPMPYSSY